jgi:hypothetical protein
MALAFMRRVIATIWVASFVVLAVVSEASAFEGGGRKPSEAPLIAIGQHYTGQLNNHKSDANYGGYKEVAIWRLPALTTRDIVTVDWHGVPFTRGNEGFPVCMVFAQGIDDYNWGSVFGSTTEFRGCDEDGPVYSLAGSGTAQTAITAQETNSTSSYLEFFADADEAEPSALETYPYDFTVQPIRHYLGVAIRAVKRVSANGSLSATATLASGSPVPDGLAFNLAVTWSGGGSASYSATSAGGAVSFPLALPETAQGKDATFVVSHPADTQYGEAVSEKLVALVAKPKPVPVTQSPCSRAKQHLRVVGRQYSRLRRHASQARGLARRRLRHRVLRVKRQLRAARAQVGAEC